MQVTSLLSRQDDEACGSCGHDHHDHHHAVLPLAQTLIGLVFVINSFVITWCFSDPASPIAAGSAMIGAIILGWPMTAGWALGLLVGINLITSGWAIVAVALAGRHMAQTVTTSTAEARH